MPDPFGISRKARFQVVARHEEVGPQVLVIERDAVVAENHEARGAPSTLAHTLEHSDLARGPQHALPNGSK